MKKNLTYKKEKLKQNGIYITFAEVNLYIKDVICSLLFIYLFIVLFLRFNNEVMMNKNHIDNRMVF